MKIHRRHFMAGSLVGLGGVVFRCLGQPLDPPGPEPFDPYEHVPLGKTGLTLSRVGLGTGMNGVNRASNQTRLGEGAFNALVRGCLDRGINWFDTADTYGSHPFLRNALSLFNRSQYTLVTKIWCRREGAPSPVDEREDAEKIVERFLKELGTDTLDLVLLHCMTEPDWPEAFEKHMTLLAKLKAKGVIRAHGVSCHSLEALQTAATEPWVDSIHERINPYGVTMDGLPEKVVPLLQTAHEAGKGIIGMKIIGAGAFRDSEIKRNHSIEFVMNLPCVDAVTVGFESLAEVDDFEERLKKATRHPRTPVNPSVFSG